MGREKSCSRNKERKTTDSKRQKFQNTPTKSQKSAVHNLNISNQEGSFKLNVDIHQVEKDILLTVPNREYKTNMPARIGETGEPVAELTKFGWMIMSPGQEDHSIVYLTQTTTHDYEQLYRRDVLGIEDISDGDQHIVYTEFKEQLRRSAQGWYQTGLP